MDTIASIMPIIVIFFVVLIIDIFFYVLYYFTTKKKLNLYNKILQNSSICEGTVESISEKQKHDRDYPNLVTYYANYIFSVNNTTYFGKFPIKVDEYKEKDIVKVYYSKDNPSLNFTDMNLKNEKNGKRFFMFLMIFMLVLGIILCLSFSS